MQAAGSSDLQQASADVERTYQALAEAERAGLSLSPYIDRRNAALKILHRLEDGDESCTCPCCAD